MRHGGTFVDTIFLSAPIPRIHYISLAPRKLFARPKYWVMSPDQVKDCNVGLVHPCIILGWELQFMQQLGNHQSFSITVYCLLDNPNGLMEVCPLLLMVYVHYQHYDFVFHQLKLVMCTGDIQMAKAKLLSY